MADTTREIIHERPTYSAAATWLALIIALAALVLAWIAYNRTGEDLEAKIQREINQAVNQGREAVDETREQINQETPNTVPAR